MPRFVRVVPLLLLLPFLTGTPAAEAMPTSALPGFCQLDATTNVWKGLGAGGTTDDWQTDANWTDGSPDTGDKDVCIPAGGQVRIEEGEEGHLETLDLKGTLTVDPGGKLFLYGDQTTNRDSVVRSAGRLNIVAGTFGGIAKLHVLGRIVLRNNGEFASTVLVRDCSYDPTPGSSYPGEEDCGNPTVAGPMGLIEVADNGVLDVQGGGVNLGDQFQLLVRGLLRVRVGAYIAADHGTRLDLAGGTLRFEGDGGYLEGKTADTLPLSELVNGGRIEKTAGSGRALVSAVYSQPPPGQVSALAGELLLPRGPAVPAQVGSGVTYGTGMCVTPDSPACKVTTNADFRQSAQFRVPTADATGASVVVHELPHTSSPHDLGVPFVLHATGLRATAGRPAVITMRFDATVLNGKTSADVRIFHKSGTAPYVRVKNCTNGLAPAGEVACVDRTTSSDVAGDAVLKIRTVETSRWVGR
jgi:hypothetical protein